MPKASTTQAEWINRVPNGCCGCGQATSQANGCSKKISKYYKPNNFTTAQNGNQRWRAKSGANDSKTYLYTSSQPRVLTTRAAKSPSTYASTDSYGNSSMQPIILFHFHKFRGAPRILQITKGSRRFLWVLHGGKARSPFPCAFPCCVARWNEWTWYIFDEH